MVLRILKGDCNNAFLDEEKLHMRKRELLKEERCDQ
jgi:hypothetical protein